MESSAYAILISLAGFLAGVLILLPIILFMVTGWSIRRDKLLSQLDEGALEVYYKQFPWTNSSQTDLTKRFKEQFGYLYGRRHYIAPTALLVTAMFSILWGVVRTIQELA